MRLSSKLWAIFLVCVFMASGTVFAADSNRIIPSGKVTLYEGDKAVGAYSEEAPLPEDITLVCSGDCGIKTKNLRMVAEDGTRFSVNIAGGSNVLQVKKGTLFFALAEMPCPIVFATPFGTYTAQQVMINTSAKGGILQGYLKVTEDTGELGVYGGSLVVTSDEGDQTIPDGKAILLAQADPVGTDQAPPSIVGGGGRNNLIVPAISIGTLGSFILLKGDDGHRHPTVSPITP